MPLFDSSCGHPPVSCTGLKDRYAAAVPIEPGINHSESDQIMATASFFIGCIVAISECQRVVSANPRQRYTHLS